LSYAETVQSVPVDMLEIGDIVRVLPGSSPPSDAKIISDEETTFDESSLTGESRPITKKKGDEVFVGTINQRKPTSVQISRTNGESM
jgi:P-type Cu+ transporter